MKNTGALLAKGKTKEIYEAVKNGLPIPGLVVVRNKPDITAFDNPAFTKQFEAKAEYATTTTCRVFELLDAAGVPVAYREQISETEFLSEKCQMVPLEVVVRRYAVGSYLKRCPEMALPEDPPYRFSDLVTEFFLKTTGGKVNEIDLGLSSEKGEEDPLIINPFESEWRLHHPKEIVGISPELGRIKADLGIFGPLGINWNNGMPMITIRTIALAAFFTLESAWGMVGYNLIDFKLELGLTTERQLVIADVIDNDSWRLRDQNWLELSKQAFRDGEALSEVERKYGLVAELVGKFPEITPAVLASINK